MTDLNKLTNINFKYLGNWIIEDCKLSYTIEDSIQKNFLYAFIVDDEIKYIGKSTQNIKKRFNGYINPGPSQKTNIKNNINIKEQLTQNKEVKIYIFLDTINKKYGEFHINLAAGLEDDIINQINPPWNGSD